MDSWHGRLIFHIDADAYFASVEQACNPFLRGKPVVVCGQPVHKGIVTAASYEAKKFGIKTGMPYFEARQILPQGIYIPGDIPKYIDFSIKLLKIYLNYTPIVEPYSIDEAFLDLSGQGNPETIASEIKKRINTEVGITVSVGVATNKLVAKIASDYQKPNGLFIVRPGEESIFLGPQPAKNCPGIGRKTTETLAKMLNVHTFSDLAAIPEEQLRYMFGVNGSKLYLAARGIDDSPVIALDKLPQEKSMGHETTFPDWISSKDQLESVIWELIAKVSFRLREKKLLAQGVRVRIKTESYGKPPKSHDRKLSRATANEKELASIAIEMFLKYWNYRAIKGVGVAVYNLVSIETAGEQLSLFDPDSMLDANLVATMDALKQKYGTGIILHGTNSIIKETKVKRGETIGPNIRGNLRL